MKRGKTKKPEFNLKLLHRIGYALLLLGLFFGKRTAAQLNSGEVSLRDLRPRDPVAERMSAPSKSASGRSPASVPDSDLANLRPGMGQGEHMFYTATDSSPRFLRQQYRTGGAEFRAVGFCRDRHGLWHNAEEKGYASCLEGQPGSSSDAIGTGQRQAGFGLLIH